MVTETEFKRISSADFNYLRSEFLNKNPVCHIPSWSMLNGSRLEVVVSRFHAYLWGKDKRFVLRTGADESSINEQAFFPLLQSIDRIFSGMNTNFPHFYLFVISYDAGVKREGIFPENDFYRLPDYYVLLPAEGLIFDHALKKGWHFFSKKESGALNKSSVNYQHSAHQTEMSETKASYLKKVDHIRELIRAGEVYQINYSVRLSKKIFKSGYEIFRDLYQNNPAPHSFYLAAPQTEFLSISPERFIFQHKNNVLTEPVKGTIPRGKDSLQDERLRQQLLHSFKDHAELNMITDLLRNDLSRVCAPDSVTVEKRRTLRSFSNVHHLVSIIKGRLEPPNSFIELIQSVFPGGSITGCPKIAAMKFINKLEIHNRSFYTGSLFIRFPLLDLTDSTILIRTGLVKNGSIHFQLGGGIVIDSQPEKEYEECMAKGETFLKVCGDNDALFYE